MAVCRPGSGQLQASATWIGNYEVELAGGALFTLLRRGFREQMIARNKAAGFAGLETPTTSEILNIEKSDRYIVGQKIGPWPIFFLGPDELVAGRDNKHMDFRLSIMKVRDGSGPSVVVSTLCMVHNRFGRYYLSSITPFHKFGLRKLITSALAAGRL
jgi:hypothetical protein